MANLMQQKGDKAIQIDKKEELDEKFFKKLVQLK